MFPIAQRLDHRCQLDSPAPGKIMLGRLLHNMCTILQFAFHGGIDREGYYSLTRLRMFKLQIFQLSFPSLRFGERNARQKQGSVCTQLP